VCSFHVCRPRALRFGDLHPHQHPRLVTSCDVTGEFHDRIDAKLPYERRDLSRRHDHAVRAAVSPSRHSPEHFWVFLLVLVVADAQLVKSFTCVANFESQRWPTLPWFPAVRLLTLLLSKDNREKHDA
jgi:hypothetical protein